MNIFATDKFPEIAATHLDDLRLRKMLVESLQILSTAVRAHYRQASEDLPQGADILYLEYLPQGRFSKWVRNSQEHYFWLLNYAGSLMTELLYRGFRVTERAPDVMHVLYNYIGLFPETDTTNVTFETCEGARAVLEKHRGASVFKDDSTSAVNAYKLLLACKWNEGESKGGRHVPVWTRRNKPRFA